MLSRVSVISETVKPISVLVLEIYHLAELLIQGMRNIGATEYYSQDPNSLQDQD